MEFNLELPPPAESDIIREREVVSEELRKVHKRDLILTSILILVTSAIVALAVFWFTASITYAILSVVLHYVGITGNTGFRSAALQMVELKNSLIALKPIPEDNADIQELSSKYTKIADYVDRVKELGRDFVNAELAMFWEWDTSTQAKTARARDYVHKAREIIESEEAEKDSVEEGESIEGFVLDDEGEKP